MFTQPYADSKPAVLTEDQSVAARRELNQMLSALSYLSQSLAAGAEVDRNLIYNILYVSESRLADLGTMTGVSTDSAEIQKNRNASLRTANYRVRELERQLGAGMSVAQTKHAVRHLCEKLNKWWREEGLGLVSDAHFDSWGTLYATLSCTLFGNHKLLDSNTPVSDTANHEAWCQSLESQGFVLAGNEKRDGHLVANDANYDALMNMVHRALPSAKCRTIKTRHNRDSNGLIIEDVIIYIDDLQDVSALPDVSEVPN